MYTTPSCLTRGCTPSSTKGFASFRNSPARITTDVSAISNLEYNHQTRINGITRDQQRQLHQESALLPAHLGILGQRNVD